MVLEASEINLSEYSVQLYGTTLVHYIDHRINQRLRTVYRESNLAGCTKTAGDSLLSRL